MGANLDATITFSHGTLSRRLEKWLSVCEVRDTTGHPVRVTAHQFRHTTGGVINFHAGLPAPQFLPANARPRRRCVNASDCC
ncbi:MAG: hypothetical protein ACLP50_11745 [Solirubrobacteraceae bacterium]